MKLSEKLNNNQIKGLNEIIKNNKSSGTEIRRAQAILMVNNNIPVEIIAEISGYRRTNIFEVRAKYLKNGAGAILDKRKGTPKEILTKKQREEITNILKSSRPLDYGYVGEFWTTGILGNFIEKRYKVKYKSKTSLYLIFREAKFTYHKPERIYHKRDEEEVKKWKEEVQPVIKEAIDEPGTIIFTEDEMILSTQTTVQRVWLPAGESVRIETSNKRENRSIYGFLDIKSGKEIAFKAPKQNMEETIKVLKKVRKEYPKNKIILLWDRALWHQGKDVQEFIKEDKHIETIYFPKYAPDENPQEHVWKAGRSHVTHNRFIENIDKATDEFIEYLNSSKFEYSLLDFNSLS